MSAHTRVVYWFDCNCDVRTKYCDENHRRSAHVELDYLRAAAAAYPTIHTISAEEER